MNPSFLKQLADRSLTTQKFPSWSSRLCNAHSFWFTAVLFTILDPAIVRHQKPPLKIQHNVKSHTSDLAWVRNLTLKPNTPEGKLHSTGRQDVLLTYTQTTWSPLPSHQTNTGHKPVCSWVAIWEGQMREKESTRTHEMGREHVNMLKGARAWERAQKSVRERAYAAMKASMK